MTRTALLAALLATAPLLAAAPSFAQAAAEPARSAELHKLFAESDEAELRRVPLFALFRGDLRFADRIGDFYSEAAVGDNLKAERAELARLARIDRAKLNATDRIAYDVFKSRAEQSITGLTPPLRDYLAVRPLDHFFGLHTFYADIASGQGAAPFKTVADYDNNVKRHREFARNLDTAVLRFRQGLKSGAVHPKLVIDNMITQLDGQLAAGVDGSLYLGPLKAIPASFSAADKARVERELRASVRNDIRPALTRLRNFLRTEYRPKARDGVGLLHMKGGRQVYDFAILSNTTLPMSADEIHTLGLSEVARIRGEMEAIKTRVGFKGTLKQFFEHIRTDPKFKPPSKEWLRDGYYEIGKRVDARIAEQFSTLPKSPLEIRPVPEYREKTDAGGSYQQGTPDGTRPGVFFYNTYDLPSRTTPGMETLYLHEGAPGHHFQISLAQENASLPSFMRFGGNTAYVEGWALYAETLWDELGMETDPYQRFGGLDDEMLRAMRLVVDSGLHAKGWTRDQSIAYMLDNSGMGRTDATAEVERYIAIPGQALAYKIGQLTILRLKAKAEQALGSRFDPREFHAQILMTGALPMTVLERKIDDWIASKRG